MNTFVLVGGQSTRMGRDKALLRFDGCSLVERSLSKLRAIRFPPQIVGFRPDLESLAPIIPDNYPNSGPLGGIEAALAASDSELNLFLPVDLPLLPAEFLIWLVGRAERTQALATVPRFQGLPQPLCAVYARALLPRIRAAIVSNRRKVMSVMQEAASVETSSLDIFDVEAVASSQSWNLHVSFHRWFENVNTSEDLVKLH